MKCMESPFFAILIPTYRRKNGTYCLLSRCLRCIKKQTFQNWKVFLIGDQYEPEEELHQLKQIIPENKIHCENLPFSPERNKYSGTQLWSVSGLSANQKGYEQIQKEEIPVICLSNDDDWWLPDHLQTLYEGYEKNASFVYTKSTHRNDILPKDNNNYPKAYNVIYSATSWKVKDIPLFLRNVVEEKTEWVAADADLWERIRYHCKKNKLRSLHMPKLTVHHDIEMNVGEYPQPLLL